MKKLPLWDHARRKRVMVYLTPAADQAKVLVSIYVATGDEQIAEKERYVWSWQMPAGLHDDVMKFVEDQIAVATEELMQLQTLMDGEPEQLDAPESPATARH